MSSPIFERSNISWTCNALNKMQEGFWFCPTVSSTSELDDETLEDNDGFRDSGSAAALTMLLQGRGWLSSSRPFATAVGERRFE